MSLSVPFWHIPGPSEAHGECEAIAGLRMERYSLTFARLKVGRAVPIAPRQVADSSHFKPLRPPAMRWGQRALPPTHLGKMPRPGHAQ
jgi:hypothetical protein